MGLFGKILDELEGAGSAVVDKAGDVASFVTHPVTEPFENGLDWQDPFAVVGNVLEAPINVSKPAIGNARYWTAVLADKTGVGNEEEIARVRAAHEAGGGRGVWEDNIVSGMNRPERMIADTLVDPLTWAGGVVKAGGALTRAGGVIGGLEDASLGQKAIGAGFRAVGPAVEKAGVVMRSPDRAVEGATEWLGKSKYGGPVLHTLGRPARGLSELSRKAVKKSTKLSTLFELSPKAAIEKKADDIGYLVETALQGGNALTPNSAAARGADAFDAGLHGMSTMGSVEGDVRAGVRRTPVDKRASEIRNTMYQSPVVRPYIDRADTAISRIRSRLARPSGGLGIINVKTPMGDAARWESAAERKEMAQDALSFMLSRADAGESLGGIKGALGNLQQIVADFRAAHPGVDDLLMRDIYRYARDMAAESGTKLPDTKFVGRAPGGGGFHGFANATAEEREQYAKNAAAGLLASLRKGGTASQFVPGGALSPEKVKLSEVVKSGELEGTGLQLPTFDEFVSEWEDEFGAGDAIEELARYYDEGLNELQSQMEKAATPKLIKGVDESTGDTVDFHDVSGMVMNSEEAARLVRAGESGINFYSSGIDDLRELFDSTDDLKLFLDLMVVTSPHTAVRANVSKAISAFLDIKTGRTEKLLEMGFDQPFIDDLTTRYKNIDGTPKTGLYIQEGMPDHRTNLKEVEAGGSPQTQKQYSFRTNFLETIDESQASAAHAFDPSLAISREEQEMLQNEVARSIKLSAGALTDDMWNQIANYLSISPSTDQFQMLEAAGRFMARKYGITPKEFQAAVWAGVKNDYGYKITDSYGTDDSPMNILIDNLHGGRDGQVYSSIADFIERGGLKHMERYLDSSRNVVKQSLEKAAKSDGDAVWRLNMNGERGMPLKSGKDSVRKPIKTKEGTITPQGVTFIEHHIPAGTEDEMARDLLRFKLQADPIFDKSWADSRIHVKSDGAGGFDVDVRYYPNTQEPGYIASLQKRLDRARAQAAAGTEDQFKIADDLLSGFIKTNELKHAGRAGSGLKYLGTDSKTSTAVGKQVDEYLASPDFEGGSFQMTPRGLEDFTPSGPGGEPVYSVSLGSAGKEGLLDRSTSNALNVSKYVKNMEPVYTGADGDLVYFGMYPTDKKPKSLIEATKRKVLAEEKKVNKANGIKDTRKVLDRELTEEELASIPFNGVSFDMNIGAVSPEEAEQIGALTNQIAYFDPTIMDDVKLTRGAMNSASQFDTPEKVQDLLDIISTSRETGESVIDVAARKGYFVEGEAPAKGLGIIGKPNEQQMTDEILNSKIVKPFRDSLERTRRAPSNDELRNTDEYLQALDFDIQELDNVDPRNMRPNLSAEQNQELYGTTFEDGTSIGRWMDEQEEQLTIDRAILDDAGIRIDPKMDLAAQKALTSDPDVIDVLTRWNKLGLPTSGSVAQNVSLLVQKRVLKESGIKPKKSGWYDKVKAVWGELALASPRYVAANLTTNSLDAIITGHWNFRAPMDIVRFGLADLKKISLDDAEGWTKLNDIHSKYGLGTSRTIGGNGTRSMIGTRAKGSQTRKVLERFGMGKLAGVVEAPLSFAQGIDVNAKLGVYMDILDSEFEQGRAELLGKLDSILQKSGVARADLNPLPSYDPGFIYGYYKKAGVPDGLARRASREVAELRNVADKKALKEVERIYLSYRKTNLDEMVGKIVPFHYWASRKVRFYAEEAYRNPMIAASYARAVEGIDRAQDDPGLNARQKGFLKLMGGPTGFTLLMNPDALMGVIKATGMGNSFTPDGQTEVGGVVQSLKRNGVGLYPWIDGALNMMGMYGDTFEPDMLGIRHRAIVGAVVNYMRGEGLLGESNRDPGAAPYTDLSLEAREKLSGWASLFLPDWLSQPVAVNAGGSASQTSLDQVIESRIIAENPDMTNEELAMIMNDPESDQYQSAYQDAARAGVIQQLLSFTAPVSFRVEENTRDTRNAAQEAITEQAQKLGINPWEVTDTNADNEFRAEYKRNTGKDFENTDWESARMQESLMRATPDSRMFVVRENEYLQIGGAEGRAVTSQYNAIRYGSQAPRGWQGDWSTAPEETRKMYADHWLKVSGNQAIYENVMAAQRSYKEKNPEFAQFKDWQSQMFDLQSLYGGSLSEYRRVVSRQNPAAARYFADQINYLESKGVPPDQMEAELDKATVSSSAWFAINGRPETIYDPQRGPQSAGLGDASTQMLAPYADQSYSSPSTTSQSTGGVPSWTELLASRA